MLSQRGKQKVTVTVLIKHFLWLRPLSRDLVEDRLHEAGLKWLRRRGKYKVGVVYLQERLDYCATVQRLQQRTLFTWAYTDGTVFYLDRTYDELEQTQQAALGKSVWRRSENRDALFQECLGPSAYSKGQGLPVRIWGVLAEGKLSVEVLEEGEAMCEEIYIELIEDRFAEWLQGSNYLVSDFEKCLRTKASVEALESIGVEFLAGPK